MTLDRPVDRAIGEARASPFDDVVIPALEVTPRNALVLRRRTADSAQAFLSTHATPVQRAKRPRHRADVCHEALTAGAARHVPRRLTSVGGTRLSFDANGNRTSPDVQDLVRDVVGGRRGLRDLSMSAACNPAVHVHQSFAGESRGTTSRQAL